MRPQNHHISVESHRSRRIAGKLDRGEELVAGLVAVCRESGVRSGEIRAWGVLDEVTLSHYDPAGRQMGPPRRFRDTVHLICAGGLLGELAGKLDVQLQVVVSRQRDNGIEVLGGQCVSARAISCEFVVEALDDALLRRSVDRASGLSVVSQVFAEAALPGGGPTDPPSAHAPSAPPPPAPQPPSPGPPIAQPSTAAPTAAGPPPRAASPEEAPPRPVHPEAVRATAGAAPAVPPAPEVPEHRPVQVGDIIEHRQFGRCDVHRVSAGEDMITVRLHSGRIVQLSLEVLDLRYKGPEGARNVFSSSPVSNR